MSSTSFTIHEARSTGVEIVQEEDVLLWQGLVSGKRKPIGPLVGKRIGLLVASEFSDFQAYYLVLYLSELGATVEFLEVGWIRWKHTRPNIRTKGVQGMWGMSIDPIPVIPAERYGHLPFEKAQQEQYDGLIVLGEHSGDLLMSELSVQDFLREALDRGAFIGAIGGGSLPLISSGILEGRRCTGSRIVRFMMETIGTYTGKEVERDGQVITASGTEATPAFVGEIVRMSDTKYTYHRQSVLYGKKIVVIAGEDFEDVELVVTVMEFLYRGAEVTLATFPAPLRARPPMLGLDVTMGNFGISVPLQEISETAYRMRKISELHPEEFDAVMIPGAFCPWNILAAEEPVEWLKKAGQAGIVIAPICHGAIAAAAADLVRGKRVTGCAQVKSAVSIMGGIYNQEWSSVIDGTLVTGRVPTDVPEFVDAVTLALLR